MSILSRLTSCCASTAPTNPSLVLPRAAVVTIVENIELQAGFCTDLHNKYEKVLTDEEKELLSECIEYPNSELYVYLNGALAEEEIAATSTSCCARLCGIGSIGCKQIGLFMAACCVFAFICFLEKIGRMLSWSTITAVDYGVVKWVALTFEYGLWAAAVYVAYYFGSIGYNISRS